MNKEPYRMILYLHLREREIESERENLRGAGLSTISDHRP